MRRIYPPPFVVFIFYGLLSLAVITSAQEVCEGGVSLNPGKRTVVVYVRGGKSPSDVQVNWDSYDYINIVVNNLFPTNVVQKAVFDGWIAARNNAQNNPKKRTKILLSIRDYDVTKWGVDPHFFGNDDGSGGFLSDAIGMINDYNLDGFDIEYPGARGRICDKIAPWDEDKITKFKDFFNDIKGKPKGKEKKLGDNKVLMLTVSRYDLGLLPDLNGNFDILNVETYHDVLYNEANYYTYPKKRFPNAPFDAFLGAYASIKDKLDKTQLVMGVDFGNTIQVVTTEDIETLESESTGSYELDKTKFPVTDQNQINKIEDICTNGPSSQLYTFPWGVLLTNTLSQLSYCVTKDEWGRRFDPKSNTPWLFKAYDNGIPNTYYFVSYEDIGSLSKKLSAIGTTGISISDVNYVNDELLNIIHNNVISKQDTGKGKENPTPTNGNTTNPDVSKNATITELDVQNKVPAIVGGVFGSIAASLLLLTAGFFWYRRKNQKSKEVPRGSFASHTALKNEGEQNQVVQNTVIPVAPGYVTAMFDFTGKEENDLSFRKGDKIEVLEKGDGPNDWWVGRVNGVVGEFPGNYVKET